MPNVCVPSKPRTYFAVGKEDSDAEVDIADVAELFNGFCAQMVILGNVSIRGFDIRADVLTAS